jgi:hypothetical protein
MDPWSRRSHINRITRSRSKIVQAPIDWCVGSRFWGKGFVWVEPTLIIFRNQILYAILALSTRSEVSWLQGVELSAHHHDVRWWSFALMNQWCKSAEPKVTQKDKWFYGVEPFGPWDPRNFKPKAVFKFRVRLDPSELNCILDLTWKPGGSTCGARVTFHLLDYLRDRGWTKASVSTQCIL